jgi:hypothetical protein
MIGISEPGPETDVVLTREQVPDVDYDSMCKFSQQGAQTIITEFWQLGKRNFQQ